MNKQIAINNQNQNRGQMTQALAYSLYTPALAPRFFAFGGAEL